MQKPDKQELSFVGLDGNDFMQKWYEPLQPISEGWVNVGDNILITSKTGGGKTRCCLNYAIHSALGKDFGNIKFEKPIPSYYLDAEMRPVSMQNKVRGFLPMFENSDLQHFRYMNLSECENGVDFCDKAQMACFIGELVELGIEQVFMDNFFSLFSSIRSWNDPNEFLEHIFPFIKKLREAKITAWWIDHNNKAGQIFGSVAKMIHFDYIFKIHHDSEIDEFDLEKIKEREKLDGTNLCFAFGEDGEVEPRVSKRIGEGQYEHFFAWAEDMKSEAHAKCEGNKLKMAEWLIKSYIDCHEGVDASRLKADWIRRKI